MAFYPYEGTKDFIVHTPALILSLRASGSITAGNGVAFDAGNTSDVYVPSAIAVNSVACAGIALKTVSDTDPVPVCVWGFLKNLVSIQAAKTPGVLISLSGSGTFGTGIEASGSRFMAGKVVSGSTSASGTFMALIDCMK